MQYEIDDEVNSIGQSVKKADRLKLNLYFDPIRRGLELMELDIALSFQGASLDELLRKKCAFADAADRAYKPVKIHYAVCRISS